MLGRTFLSLVNLGVLGGTLTVWFALPQYSTYALYGCLAWVVVAFALMYSAWGNRPLARPAGSATASGSPVPLPRGSPVPTASAAPLDFCIYCAAPMAGNATRCPACGHAAARG